MTRADLLVMWLEYCRLHRIEDDVWQTMSMDDKRHHSAGPRVQWQPLRDTFMAYRHKFVHAVKTVYPGAYVEFVDGESTEHIRVIPVEGEIFLFRTDEPL